MALQVTELNGVKVYNLTSGKTLPQWLAEKQRKALKKDTDFRRRVELLQDFDFATGSQRVKMSRDGEYCVATGTYPPMVKVFEVEQLCMKFERHLDSEVVNFEILDDGWGKLAFLHVDRTVEFHAPYGRHYRVRVPKAGRDLLYHKPSCDLFVAASSSQLYRINLEEGRFLAPLEASSAAVNVLAQSDGLQLMASGGDDGIVQCWDLRTNKSVARFDVGAVLGDGAQEVSALTFDPKGGITMAVGTSRGYVSLFDLRSTAPVLTKEHQYGDPIVRVRYHSSGRMISADQHVIKIWDKHQGKILTNIETSAAVNDFCVVKSRKTAEFGDSGVLMVAGEQARIMSYYVPQLGVAPHWCSFLDSLTEELEETPTQTVFEDYKFVTREELKNLGLQHLVGTPLLKTYMHGFFMDARLYARVQTVADPFAYDKWRKKKVKEKIDAKRKSRITIQRRLPKVNQDLAIKLIADGAKEASEAEWAKAKAAGKTAPDASSKAEKRSRLAKDLANPLRDERFSAMFTNPDFQIDLQSDEFRRRHGGNQPKTSAADLQELFEEVEGGDSGDEVTAHSAGRGSGAGAGAGAGASKKGRGRTPRMYEVSETAASAGALVGAVGLGGQADVEAVAKTRTAAARSRAPLLERVEAGDGATATKKGTRHRGVREYTFTPSEGSGAGGGLGSSGPRSAREREDWGDESAPSTGRRKTKGKKKKSKGKSKRGGSDGAGRGNKRRRTKE